MVAYSFKKCFVPPIEQRLKRQTVRGDRKRHARPDESIQLYYAMRTKQCRKIIPDPVCLGVSPIEIEVRDSFAPISMIAVNECELVGDRLMEFAIADGFDLRWHQPKKGHEYKGFVTALTLMGFFWLEAHGEGRFTGSLITWEPSLC